MDIWTIPLDDGFEDWPRLLNSLSSDEQVRASRFRFRRDQRRFVIARAGLREILGRYLEVSGGPVPLTYGPNGKPELASDVTHRVEFNASRSQGLSVVAVSDTRRLGIDVEFVSQDIDWRPLAERFFSAREIADLRACPQSMQREAFFACWTRKEAYLKARGDGLFEPLDCFSVAVGPSQPAAIIQAHPSETRTWSLEAFCPAPGFEAALAVEGSGWVSVRRSFASVNVERQAQGKVVK